MKNKLKIILLISFIVGYVVLSFEMTVSRLLAPFFGSSTIVWALIISTILVYASIGTRLIGYFSDKYDINKFIILPIISFLYTSIIVLPLYKITQFIFYNKFLNNIIIFFLLLINLILINIPIIFISGLIIVLIKFTINDSNNGNIIGKIYSINTIGSVFGILFTSIIILPILGMKFSLYLLILLNIIITFLYYFLLYPNGNKKIFLKLVILFLISIFLIILDNFLSENIKPKNLLFSTESLYNYIHVYKINNQKWIFVNEPYFAQSYVPDNILDLNCWTSFLIMPYLNCNYKNFNTLIIGWGCGTTGYYFNKFYSNSIIIGVEIDKKMVDIGNKLIFTNTNLNKVYIDDGRIFLYKTTNKFNYIISDAYRYPYIPHHLLTYEYFNLIRKRLTQDGVFAINVAMIPESDYYLDYIISTIKKVFPYGICYKLNSHNVILFFSSEKLKLCYENIENLFLRRIFDHFILNSKEIDNYEDNKFFHDDDIKSEFFTHIMGIKFYLNFNNYK